MAMKRKTTMALCIESALTCAFSVALYTGQVRQEANQARNEALSRYGGEQLEVCVASQDIPAGETITSANATTKMWLVDLLPTEAVESFDDVSGKRATSSIVEGEVLSSRQFEGSSLNISVPSGLQAVSVELDQAQAVGGALEAGSIVDVYASGPSETSLLISGAYVASAGNGSGSSSWVTLAVEPSQVEQVIAATQSSTLYLTLPSQTEKEEEDAEEQ